MYKKRNEPCEYRDIRRQTDFIPNLSYAIATFRCSLQQPFHFLYTQHTNFYIEYIQICCFITAAAVYCACVWLLWSLYFGYWNMRPVSIFFSFLLLMVLFYSFGLYFTCFFFFYIPILLLQNRSSCIDLSSSLRFTIYTFVLLYILHIYTKCITIYSR